jgi:hypothetical protein
MRLVLLKSPASTLGQQKPQLPPPQHTPPPPPPPPGRALKGRATREHAPQKRATPGRQQDRQQTAAARTDRRPAEHSAKQHAEHFAQQRAYSWSAKDGTAGISLSGGGFATQRPLPSFSRSPLPSCSTRPLTSSTRSLLPRTSRTRTPMPRDDAATPRTGGPNPPSVPGTPRYMSASAARCCRGKGRRRSLTSLHVPCPAPQVSQPRYHGMALRLCLWILCVCTRSGIGAR